MRIGFWVGALFRSITTFEGSLNSDVTAELTKDHVEEIELFDEFKVEGTCVCVDVVVEGDECAVVDEVDEDEVDGDENEDGNMAEW